jgi:hypothetical protein
MYGLDLTQIYNPQNNTWSLGAAPPHPAKGLEEEEGGDYVGAATTGVMAPERIYAIGSSYTQVYNPVTNSWSLGEAISPSRDGFAVVNMNDTMYVMGGSTITGDLNADVATETEFSLTQQYTPDGYGTPDPSYIIEHTPPQISFETPLNQTYNDSSVSIVFTVNKNITMASYSLDGEQNVTLSGNTTIANIPNGFHDLTIYANDTYGNVGSQAVNFTVEKPQMEVFGSPITIVVIAVPIASVILIVGLVLFQKHRKSSNLKQ